MNEINVLRKAHYIGDGLLETSPTALFRIIILYPRDGYCLCGLIKYIYISVNVFSLGVNNYY